MMPAARIGDPIAHSEAGLGMGLGILAGVVAGAVLVGATIATGGAALAVVAAVGGAAGLVSFGGLSGMHIGEASMGPACGDFTIGSPTVFINGRPATFTAGSFATCAKDEGEIPLATGAASVIINTGMAGREGEKLGCSAVAIAACSPNVFIGGPSAQDPRVAITPEVPAWAVTGLEVLGIAGLIATLPFSIAAVGVAATLGGLAGGFLGGALGAKGGRALGEALGLSEAQTRALEAGGGFLGGLLGGAAGTRGASALGNRVLPKATSPLGQVLRSGATEGNPATVAAVNRMPADFQAEYASAKAANWTKPDGTRWYPPNNGGIGTPKVTRLDSGVKLDRFGSETGAFMSNSGDSFEARALPPESNGVPNKYTTAIGRDGKSLAVEESPIAPWFDQPGGGTQYRLVDPVTGGKYSVDQAIRQGYLTRGH